MRILFLFCSLFFLYSGLQAQNDCSGYFPFEEGSYFVQNSYDHKGKLSSTTRHEVNFLMDSDEGTEAQVDLTIWDEKGEEVAKSDYLVTCIDGDLVLDMRSITANMMEIAMEDMDIDIETSGMVLPAKLNVGDKLDDAYSIVKVGTNGMVIMTTRMDVTDRKVIGSELLTTPAGTFNCMVLTSNTRSKAMITTMEFETKQWFAEGHGMIRSESYRKGKLESYTEMVEFGTK
ncbi:MAG: hypothetical protein KDC34_08410 [Saprospiraceae bacterium]|nr:hypothetical protein [Saprospiraceae bacterium]